VSSTAGGLNQESRGLKSVKAWNRLFARNSDRALGFDLTSVLVEIGLIGAQDDFSSTVPGPPPLWLNINFTEDQFRKAADGIVIPRDVPLNAQATKVRVIVYDEGLHSLGSVTVPVK
jgi:hypothetical protein